MEVDEAIKKRKSIRGYKDEPVPEEKLLKVLEAARLAPSGANKQQYKLVVIKDPEKRKQLSIAAEGQSHIAAAPVVILGVATHPDVHMPNGVLVYPIDLAIAFDHMMLAAINEGLGSCWIGRFSQDQAKQVMGISDNYVVFSMLTLGFPADEGRIKIRKSLDELVCYEAFSDQD
jgi:nitroreductase